MIYMSNENASTQIYSMITYFSKETNSIQFRTYNTVRNTDSKFWLYCRNRIIDLFQYQHTVRKLVVILHRR